MKLWNHFLRNNQFKKFAGLVFILTWSSYANAGVDSISNCHKTNSQITLQTRGLASVAGKHYRLGYTSGRAHNSMLRFKVLTSGLVYGLSNQAQFTYELGFVDEFVTQVTNCSLKTQKFIIYLVDDRNLYSTTAGRKIGSSPQFLQQQLFNEGLLINIDHKKLPSSHEKAFVHFAFTKSSRAKFVH